MKKNKMKLMAIGCALTFAVAVTGCSKQSSTKETAVVETESKTSEVTVNEAVKPEHASGTTAMAPSGFLELLSQRVMFLRRISAFPVRF